MPLPDTVTFDKLITTEYTMGKMVTAPTKISAGAVNVHPSRAILLRLTSGRPTSGAAAGACSAALEMVAIGHTPCP